MNIPLPLKFVHNLYEPLHGTHTLPQNPDWHHTSYAHRKAVIDQGFAAFKPGDLPFVQRAVDLVFQTCHRYTRDRDHRLANDPHRESTPEFVNGSYHHVAPDRSDLPLALAFTSRPSICILMVHIPSQTPASRLPSSHSRPTPQKG